MSWFREGQRLVSSGVNQSPSLFLELPEGGDQEKWVVPALPLTNPRGYLLAFSPHKTRIVIPPTNSVVKLQCDSVYGEH